jgi:hypothetical protein
MHSQVQSDWTDAICRTKTGSNARIDVQPGGRIFQQDRLKVTRQPELPALTVSGRWRTADLEHANDRSAVVDVINCDRGPKP